MTPLIPSFRRLVMASTFLVPSMSIWSRPSVTKFAMDLTVSSTTPSKSLMARRMPPITMLVVTTPSERKLSIKSLIVFASSPITARVFRDSSSFMPLVEVPVRVSVLSFSRDFRWTTDASPSFRLPSLPLLRFPLPWLSR